MIKTISKNRYTLCPAIKVLYLFAAVVTMALASVTPWFKYSCEVFQDEFYTISQGPIYIFNEILGFTGPLSLFDADGSLQTLMLVGPMLLVLALAMIGTSVGFMCASRTTPALVLNLLGVVTTVASVITTGVVEYSVMDSNLSRYSFTIDEIDFVFDKVGFFPGLAIDYLGFGLAFIALIGIAVWAYLVNSKEKVSVDVAVTKFSFAEVLKPAMKAWAYKVPVLFGLSAIACIVMGFVALNLLYVLSALALVALSAMFSLGKAKISIAAVKDQEVSGKTFFSVWTKGNIGRCFGGYLWYALFVTLWFMIPVVGVVFGVIKAYEYRFTPYILVDNANISATDAIKLSKKMTYGNKGKMFAIDMATIGTFAAAVIIFAVLTVVPFIGTIGTIYLVVALVALASFASSYFGCIKAQEYVVANEKYEG